MARDSFIFYRSFYEAIKEVPEDSQLQIYKAISIYALEQEEIELTGISKAIFSLVKPQLDANYKKYENGKQNKSKAKAKDKQKESKAKTNVNDNDNVNENANENKKEQEEKIHFADFVSMTNAEHEKLVSTHGKDFVDQCITVLDNYKGSNGKTYKSDYRAILSWVIDKVKEQQAKNKKESNQTKNYNNYMQRQYDNLNNLYANKGG